MSCTCMYECMYVCTVGTEVTNNLHHKIYKQFTFINLLLALSLLLRERILHHLTPRNENPQLAQHAAHAWHKLIRMNNHTAAAPRMHIFCAINSKI